VLRNTPARRTRKLSACPAATLSCRRQSARSCPLVHELKTRRTVLNKLEKRCIFNPLELNKDENNSNLRHDGVTFLSGPMK
jgi:hypothetical protein